MHWLWHIYHSNNLKLFYLSFADELLDEFVPMQYLVYHKISIMLRINHPNNFKFCLSHNSVDEYTDKFKFIPLYSIMCR